MADYAYKRYRMIRGKLALESLDAEDVCKLIADGFTFADVNKYIPSVTKERYDGFMSDLMFLARLEFLKRTKTVDKDEPVAHSAESLKKFSIENLIELSKKSDKQDNARIQALKTLWEIAQDMSAGTIQKSESAEDKAKKAVLKKTMDKVV